MLDVFQNSFGFNCFEQKSRNRAADCQTSAAQSETYVQGQEHRAFHLRSRGSFVSFCWQVFPWSFAKSSVTCVAKSSSGRESWVAEGKDSGREKMEVSIHGGTPNHPFKLDLSIINNPFWGTSILGNHHMVFVFRFRSWESFAFVYLSSQFDCLNDSHILWDILRPRMPTSKTHQCVYFLP